MTAKLHEVLAVEKDLSNTSSRMISEAIKTFSKDNLFKGSVKEVELFDEEEKALANETIKLETNVYDILNYAFIETANFWDSTLQKDKSNQVAVADIIVDGNVIASAVPSSFLLGLEGKLNSLMQLFQSIPTLEPGREWVLDESYGEGIFKDKHPREQFKTKKDKEFKTVAPSTDRHPAQVVPMDVVTNVGKITTTNWSGMISSAEKANMMKRLSTLLRAVKKARQRANNTNLVDGHIGKDLLSYIITG